ncbi:Uncharacterised protein [Streptococcus pneumoniae]|nr:Uncharacterised protein [Streptococcus pneumoniae]
MVYKVYKACKVHEVNKVFLDLEGQMVVHNILTWPMPITQQVVDSVKQTLTKPLLECTLTLIQQTAEILLIIAGQDGKVVMAQMAWQVRLVQMVGHHTYT